MKTTKRTLTLVPKDFAEDAFVRLLMQVRPEARADVLRKIQRAAELAKFKPLRLVKG